MAATIAANGQFEQRVVEIGTATATSTDTETVIATIDARGFSYGTFTAKNNGAQSVSITIYGSNDPAFGDENTVASLGYKATTVTAGSVTTFFTGVAGNVTSQAALAYAYYRIKLVNSTLASSHASSTTVWWCLKNT